MMLLEMLLWMSLGAAMALIRLTLGALASPPEGGWARTFVWATCAGLFGGWLGLALSPTSHAGDFNAASIVLASTAAALMLLVLGAIDDHRSIRKGG